ncbi:MAG: ABC transporter ATP-binding protein [Flavobacteriales bacterium]|nr:ABC transporter ATP-binding protein [Flavobacteriales bacterium]MBL6873003.1 ABC transporter ATP-binding protein [Flavobacteriales bacterium]
MIKVNNIFKSYGDLEVLKGVNLSVKAGETVSIVGASGAGKTTLLQIIGTLDKADSGEIEIANNPLQSLNDKKLSTFRNESIGFVFQFHNLLSEFNALENICLPAFIKGVPKTEAEKRAKKLLLMLNLKDRSHHKPNELSGGEQQRVAVARALINNPAVLLADEPSGNLDSKNAEQLHDILLNINKETDHACVIVTHNKDLANMADRKLTMVDGNII